MKLIFIVMWIVVISVSALALKQQMIVQPIRFGNEINNKVMITSEGGYAIKLNNTIGNTSTKGYLVQASRLYDNGLNLSQNNQPDVIGVFYESGIPNGEEAWVVVSGIADVYFINNATRGYVARSFVTADSGFVQGQALAESVPSTPFATDKHFAEIGHVLESRTGAGLARVVLHFN